MPDVTIITGPAAGQPLLYDGFRLTYNGYLLVVNSSDKSGYLRVGTLRVRDQVQSRSTARMSFLWEDGTIRVTVGEQIAVYGPENEVLFGGVIDDATHREDHLGRVWSDVRCVDWAALLDRHRVAGAYEDTPAGDIVRDLMTDSAVSSVVQEAFNLSGVATGDVVPAISFNYVTVADALDQLAEFVGFTWGVTGSKGLLFRARNAAVAPFTITDSSTNYRAISVGEDKHEYRNRQYLRAGRDLTDSRVEDFVGDGTRKAFTLAFPVGTVPSITVNSVAQTVGIRGLETGFDWYWNKNDPVISQDDGGTPLTSGDTLEVTYQGLFPILVLVNNVPQQNTRAVAEGTSGIYSHIAQEASIDQREVATSRAQALMSRYGQFQKGVNVEVDTNVNDHVMAVRAGDLLTITKARFGLNLTACLIDTVDWTLGEDGTWHATLQALTGTQTKSWLRYWQALAEDRRDLPVRENEVVIVGGDTTSFADAVDLTDALTATDAAPETRVGFAQVGYSEIG